MKTVITEDPDEAAAFIRSGGIVAFPTETVYGLGANVFDQTAVGRIFEAKERPADNPLIVHVSTIDQIFTVASHIQDFARKLIEAFFPGPLSIVLEKHDRVPYLATAGLESVGVRMPANELAAEFLQACDTPVAAPSANRSGRPSPTTWEAVVEDLDGRIDCILKGAATELGLESTVVDCTGGRPIVLRKGGVTLADIQALVPEAELLGETDGELEKRSPGLRHKHYSPRAHVRIGMPDSDDCGYIGLTEPSLEMRLKLICSDVDDYARSLFEFFRVCDRRGVASIFCEPVTETGIGSALMDRIRRAAE